MSALLVTWLAFPLLLAGLCLGCGRLLEAVSGARLPGALVLPAGLTVVILAGEFATMSGPTAELSGPLVVTLAVAGLLLSAPWRERPDLWAYGAATGAFAVYAAPIVLSGEATFAGYIKLDDTATYFAMTDRIMEHGRSLAGLAPSTYEATLATTIGIGYPTGSLMPLGIGHQLLSYDIAWLYQPYLTFLAAMLALAVYTPLGAVIRPRPLRAAAAFVASQSAILVGYALWGGVKELLGAVLLGLIAALLAWTLHEGRSLRAVLPLAAASAAVVCVLSLPGALWLAPALVAAAVVIARRPTRPLLAQAAAFSGALVVLAIPSIVAAIDWLPRIGSFGKETNLGNLIEALSPFQVFGIWPAGDFRVDPTEPGPAYVLIALVIAAGLVGLWWAWLRRGWSLLAYVLVAGVGCALYVGVSSPWVGGKTLAMASPAMLAAAFAGCGAGFAGGRLVEASVAALAVAAGVLWSNVLQYHDVWLAPREQLHELEVIGDRFAGRSPALMNTYEPYGARHFLRREAAEGASELRRRFVYLRDGTTLEKGASADIDRFRLAEVLVYRLLVLRRGPAASRPPSVYRLVWSGRYYQVWERPASPERQILEHLSLGDENQAAAVPRCADVRRLARLATGGSLVVATRPTAIPVTTPPLSGSVTLQVSVPTAGSYTAWLGGDWYGLASVTIDGRKVGSEREELNWPGLFTDLGTIELAAGAHELTLEHDVGGWHPGSGGASYAFGPLVLSAENARNLVDVLSPAEAPFLCGHRLDWIEAVR